MQSSILEGGTSGGVHTTLDYGVAIAGFGLTMSVCGVQHILLGELAPSPTINFLPDICILKTHMLLSCRTKEVAVKRAGKRGGSELL